jgi:hypothetical protein
MNTYTHRELYVYKVHGVPPMNILHDSSNTYTHTYIHTHRELCVYKVHGVPPMNILHDSSSAFVNFTTYEAADAARRGLQGRTMAGAGPLKINASDYMQQYEDAQKEAAATAKKTDGFRVRFVFGACVCVCVWCV